MNKNAVNRALLTTLFIIVLAVDCVLIYNRTKDYRLYTKLPLTPILYILMAVQTSAGTHKRSKLFLTLAIFLSLASDFLLLYASDNVNFIYGLLFQFAAHVSYGLLFLRLKAFKVKRLISIILMGMLLAIYLSFVISTQWTAIGDQGLEGTMIFNALGLGFMSLTAFHTAYSRRIKNIALLHFIPGTLLFIASDSIMIIDKFLPVIEDRSYTSHLHMYYGVAIMLLYAFGQLLYVSGVIRIIRN